MELTNFSIGEQKRRALLGGFGALPQQAAPQSSNDDLEKGLNKSGLTLKEITMKGGKKAHRWVNDKDEEHAPMGAKASFDHGGQKLTGTVGRISKSSGKYILQGDDGEEYRKHHHEITPHTGTVDANGVDNDSDKASTQATGLDGHAKKHDNAKLQAFVDKHKDDPDQADAVKAAQDALTQRSGANSADPDTDDLDDDKDPDNPADKHDAIVNHVKGGKTYKKGSASIDYHAGSDKFLINDSGNKKATDEAGLRKWLKGKGHNSTANDIEAKDAKSAADIKAESDAQETEDINERFDDFADYVEGVVMGFKKAAIMYGSGGVGKTWTTTEKLKDLGLEFYNEKAGHEIGSDDYDVVTIEGGRITPTSFYQNMWDHNGKVIVFDDCDSALQHDDIRGFLKGALGSNQSKVTNATAGKIKDSSGNDIPKQFEFTGKMIFISNLPKKYILGKDMQPIMSRAFSTDMTMTRGETINRIRHISTDKGTGKLTNMKFDGIKNYSHEEMEDVLNLLDKYKDQAYDINARTVETLLGMKKLADKRFTADPAAAKADFERKAKKNLLQHLDADGNDITKAVHDDLHKAFTTDLNQTYSLDLLGVDYAEQYAATMKEKC